MKTRETYRKLFKYYGGIHSILICWENICVQGLQFLGFGQVRIGRLASEVLPQNFGAKHVVSKWDVSEASS